MKVPFRCAALMSVVVLSGLSACGAPDAPPAPPLPSAPTTYKLSTADTVFLQQVDEMDLLQMKIAGLAATHSNSDIIKSFATTLIGDHTTNRKAVAKIVASGNLTVTDKLNAADAEHLASLSHLYGSGFDRVFLREVIGGPTSGLKTALNTQSQTGGSADIKTLASDTSKMLDDHANRAQDLSGYHAVKKKHHVHRGRYY